MRTSTSADLSDLTALQKRVLREIVAWVRREGRPLEDHLREVDLAERIGTSRSPVQAALRFLVFEGLVRHDPNRGFFMARPSAQWSGLASRLVSTPDDPLYLQMAEDRRAGHLPDEVNEAEMMRRYEVARSRLRKVLARMSEEGWVEQNLGHGWRFLPMIDTPEAYEESYLFRQAIEPVGLLSPGFRLDALELMQLRREQQAIVDGGFKTMTPIELFEANSRFHEILACWSGNRFIAQSVRRVNLQRRLEEYHQASKRTQRQTQAQEHLQILDAIASQDLIGAAALLRNHLDGARRSKSHSRA